MKKALIAIIIGLCLLLALPLVALAAYEAGTATFPGIGSFPIYGFHQNITSSSTSVVGGGRSSGKATWGPVVLAKSLDSYSPIFFAKAATGENFSEVTLTFPPETAEPAYLIIKLLDAMIVGIDLKNEPYTAVSR
jgi:type VI protein secretion system component Hcp